MRRGITRRGTLGAGIALLAPAIVRAQEKFPSRTMTWVVPFPAGGTTDLLARIFAQKVGEAFGQSVVVENAGGGGGSIGADKVAKAAPDGYTLLLHNVTFSTTTSSLMATGRAKHTFDDFMPVSLAANVPLVVMCHPSVPAKDLKEFVAYTKEQNKADKGVFYGTTGSRQRDASRRRGVEARCRHQDGARAVPRRGAAGAGTAHRAHSARRRPDFHLARSYARRRVAWSRDAVADARTVAMPDLPTVREQGFPNMELFGWNGFFAPAKTPPSGRRGDPGRNGQGRARSGREAPPCRGRRRGDGLDPGRARQGAARSGRGGEAAGRRAEARRAIAAMERLLTLAGAFGLSLIVALVAAWRLVEHFWYGEDLDLFVPPLAGFVLVATLVFGLASDARVRASRALRPGRHRARRCGAGDCRNAVSRRVRRRAVEEPGSGPAPTQREDQNGPADSDAPRGRDAVVVRAAAVAASAGPRPQDRVAVDHDHRGLRRDAEPDRARDPRCRDWRNR